MPDSTRQSIDRYTNPYYPAPHRFDIMEVARRRAAADEQLRLDAEMFNAIREEVPPMPEPGVYMMNAELHTATRIQPPKFKAGDRVQINARGKEFMVNDVAIVYSVRPSEWHRVFTHKIIFRAIEGQSSVVGMGITQRARVEEFHGIASRGFWDFPAEFLELYVSIPYTTNTLGDFPKREGIKCPLLKARE